MSGKRNDRLRFAPERRQNHDYGGRGEKALLERIGRYSGDLPVQRGWQPICDRKGIARLCRAPRNPRGNHGHHRRLACQSLDSASWNEIVLAWLYRLRELIGSEVNASELTGNLDLPSQSSTISVQPNLRASDAETVVFPHPCGPETMMVGMSHRLTRPFTQPRRELSVRIQLPERSPCAAHCMSKPSFHRETSTRFWLTSPFHDHLCSLLFRLRRGGGTDFFSTVDLIERERPTSLLRGFDQSPRAGRWQVLLAGFVVRNIRRRLPEYFSKLTLLHAQGEADRSEIGCHAAL